MWWKGRYNFVIVFLFLFLFSCDREKKYQDYNEKDFYEVQGVITKVYQTYSIFDSSYNNLMDYSYAINDSVYLEGKEREFHKAWQFGDPIVILVHRDDSSISFYARNGVVNSFSEKQFEMFNTILEIDSDKKKGTTP